MTRPTKRLHIRCLPEDRIMRCFNQWHDMIQVPGSLAENSAGSTYEAISTPNYPTSIGRMMNKLVFQDAARMPGSF